ncbi:MAG TPA: T9SS type A sorting domain-containing protein [Lentimicrobium sp.]|nr:T9SS type A sorting domain-containing protein [Lentimicrobium sp.]
MNKTILILFAVMALHVFSEAQEITMPACQPVWKYAMTGSEIGLNSLQYFDYDGDGLLELVVGTHSGANYKCSYWYKVEYDPLTMSFNQVWVSPYYQYDNYGPTVIESFDADNDGLPEIVVGYSNSLVDIIDPVTMVTEASFKIPSWDEEVIYRIIRADADNDGEEEIVCCTTNATYLMHPGSYTSDLKIWYGAKDMRCGNVDSVAGLELVYGNGSVVNITNGQPQQLWDFTTIADTYRKPIRLFDLDTDGIMEIFYLNDGDLIIYDAVHKQERLRILHQYDEISDVLVADTYTGNGREIILGRGNGITFHNLEGELVREYKNYNQSGANGIFINDIDKDGDKDLIFASGGGSSTSDKFTICNLQLNELLYESPILEGPVWGFKIADTDNDGRNEFVFLNNDYNTIMTCLDPAERKVKWQGAMPGMDNYYTGVDAYDISDFDNDGDNEIVHLSDHWETKVTVINARTHEIEWVNSFPDADDYRMNSIMIKDADQDGMQEFITGNANHIYFVNPVDFSIEWSSPEEWTSEYYGSGTSFKIANTDTDPNLELVWLTDGKMLVVDCYNKQLELEVDNIRAFTLFDLDKDGISEIFYSGYIDWQGSELGYINGITGEKTVFSDQYYSDIAVFDVPGRTTPVVAGFSYGNLYFLTIDGRSITEPLAITGNVYYNNHNQLCITDYDNNGVNELFVQTNETLNEIDLSCYSPLWLDEPEDLTNQSIELYPNPAGGTIFFKTVPRGEATVYNSQGSEVMRIPAGTRSADVSNLCSGLYLLKVVAVNQQLVTKFIKR